MFDIDEWTEKYHQTAIDQNWYIIDTGYPGNGSLEIRGFLISDRDAVAAMQLAFDRNEDHALQAYALLKNASPMEFGHWRMWTWNR